jgi:hypothetical protein
MTSKKAPAPEGTPGPDPAEESEGSLRQTADISPRGVFSEPDPETPPEEPEDEPRPTNREARYRRQLRDTEAERDTLLDRLATVQRGEVERLAATHLQDGADLWANGATLDDLLDDAGNIDPAKVATACKEAAEAHPHWQKGRAKAGTLQSGSSAGREPQPSPWAAAFVRKER